MIPLKPRSPAFDKADVVEYFRQSPVARDGTVFHFNDLRTESHSLGGLYKVASPLIVGQPNKPIHDSGLSPGNLPQMLAHPRGSVSDVLDQPLLVLIIQFALQGLDHGIIHVFLAQVPQRLDDQTADAVGRSHAPRRRPLGVFLSQQWQRDG